jgi:hypothetical protein
MSTSKQSQSAARRRGELQRANGDRHVAQTIRARRHLTRRHLNTLPLRAGAQFLREARRPAQR